MSNLHKINIQEMIQQTSSNIYREISSDMQISIKYLANGSNTKNPNRRIIRFQEKNNKL